MMWGGEWFLYKWSGLVPVDHVKVKAKLLMQNEKRFVLNHVTLPSSIVHPSSCAVSTWTSCVCIQVIKTQRQKNTLSEVSEHVLVEAASQSKLAFGQRHSN